MLQIPHLHTYKIDLDFITLASITIPHMGIKFLQTIKY